MERLRILVIAHELSPTQGSECSVGWNIVTNLSKFHDLTVLYAETNQFNTSNYKIAVEQYERENERQNGLNFISIPQPRYTRFLVSLNRLISPKKSAIGFAPLFYKGYRAWQKKAYIQACALSKAKSFDIVHQLTAISFREPGLLWKFDSPFVWGPCSGLVKIPTTFYNELTKKEIAFELLRSLANFMQSHCSYRINEARKKASMIYTVTLDDFIYFNTRASGKVKQMLDVGSFSESIEILPRVKRNSHLKLLWIGRVVYTKALDILLYAMNDILNVSQVIELTIIGDGPLLLNYKSLAQKLNLNNINWLGTLSHEDVFNHIKDADVLVHTSIKEATSAVILESLTYGLPVICHEAFGMSYAINNSCGIKIPLQSKEDSIKGFKKAINDILKDDSLLNNLSIGAIQRSKELSWTSMAEVIANDYIEIHNENIINK